MKHLLIIAVPILFLVSCNFNADKKRQQARDEIFQTEKAFEKMTAEKGMADAFSFFAADSGVVNRGDTILRGKETIHSFYAGRKNRLNVSLKWTPDFIDVSKSCDLGYTYGRYNYSFTDSTGKINESTGTFHTVWKKQNDGTWRFVWD